MTGLSGGTEGVAAIIDLPHIYTDPKKAAYLVRRPNARVLALDALQDPGNVGTLIRTAHLLKWDLVCLGVGTADTTNDKVTRASGGTTWDQPLYQGCISALMSEMVAQADNGRPVQYLVADHSAEMECGRGVFAQRDGNADKEDSKEAAVVLVLGNEGNGSTIQTPEAVANGAKTIKIRTREATMVGSLGVASAGAILMHDLR
jgi:tRNA G18 (ribose-2'-O)-methylase SpoU